MPLTGIRDTPQDDRNPYSVEERMTQWQRLHGDKVRFCRIPEDGDGLEVWYGRGVGWGIRGIEAPSEFTRVSGILREPHFAIGKKICGSLRALFFHSTLILSGWIFIQFRSQLSPAAGRCEGRD